MKKVLSVLLATTMVFSLMACGNSESGEDAPLDVLTKIWETYEEDEKFEAVGGDPNNIVEGAPGTVDITNEENLDVSLGFPQSSAALLDDAASLIHALNQNTFTAGAYHVSDTSEIEMLTADLHDNIVNRQWLDGIPDKLIIVGIGENIIVSAFGNTEMVDTFKEKVVTVYNDVTMYYEENL